MMAQALGLKSGNPLNADDMREITDGPAVHKTTLIRIEPDYGAFARNEGLIRMRYFHRLALCQMKAERPEWDCL